GPTWPNRMFVHAATSAGQIDNNVHENAYNIDTIYDRLDEKGEPWKIYFHDFPQSIALIHLQKDFVVENRFRLFADFLEDAAQGHLPAYSFIEPRYTDFLFIKANDQHPPHDVALGEHLIADVYEAVRDSPQWNQTALIVLWDEHGAFYDHVPPPPAVNPDNKVSVDPACDFKRLGVRVPALIISPYVTKGTISNTTYDHTSVLATVEKRFGLRSLTNRDAAAATFESVFGSTLRTDAPLKLDRPTDAVALSDYEKSKSALAELTNDAVRDALRAFDFSKTPATEFQISLVKLAKSIFVRGETQLAAAIRLSQWADIEHDAAAHLREFSSKFFSHIF
ncbi:MAG: alkaline phosphatase family protein, partial [Blastocatellia bacterium]